MTANPKKFLANVDLSGNLLNNVGAGVVSTDGANVGQLPTLPLSVANGGTGAAVNAIGVIGGCVNGGVAQNLTRYVPPYCSTVFATSVASQRMRIARASVMQKLYIDVANAPAAGQLYVFTILVNGTAPGAGLTVSIPAAGISGSDLTSTVALGIGDQVELKIVTSPTSGATGAIIWSAEIVATA